MTRTATGVLVTAWAAASAFVSAAANPASQAGLVTFNNTCRTCHSIKPGDNRQGPSLYGVVGRKAGTAPGYAAYSQSLASSAIVWDETSLDRFIENPDRLVPGNKMRPYTGITDPSVRKAIIRFLAAQGRPPP